MNHMQYSDPNELISFADADNRADRFEQVLRTHGIDIRPGSALERGLLLLHEIRQRHENPNNTAPWENLGYDLQEALGILHFVQLVLRNAENPEFSKVIPHLSQINLGEIAQTKRVAVTDQVSNKLFELTVSLGIMERGKDLQLDDPVTSLKGKNPDIIARMHDDSFWGFACKVYHGNALRSLFDLIVDGVDQIQRSPADTGAVIVSFKNKIPHEDLLLTLGTESSGIPILGVHRDLSVLVQHMKNFVSQRVEAMIREVGTDEVWETLRSKKALPGVVIHVIAGVGIQTQTGATPSIVGFLQAMPLEFSPLFLPTRFDARSQAILEDVNRGLRVIP